MNQSINTKPSGEHAPLAERAVPAALAILIGLGVLCGTTLFYTRVVDVMTFDLLNWVQPVMLGASGTLCMIGALVLLKNARAGRVLVQFALGLLPLILAWRLVLVGFRMAMRAAEWSIANADRMVDGSMLREWRPSWLVIANIVVVLLIVVSAVLTKAIHRSRKE
jgi:hypothetical protein